MITILGLKNIKIGRIYKKENEDSYNQVNDLLSNDQYNAIKRYSACKKNGKYLVVLTEEIYDEYGDKRTERTIDQFETDKIRTRRSYWGIFLFALIVLIMLLFVFA